MKKIISTLIIVPISLGVIVAAHYVLSNQTCQCTTTEYTSGSAITSQNGLKQIDSYVIDKVDKEAFERLGTYKIETKDYAVVTVKTTCK